MRNNRPTNTFDELKGFTLDFKSLWGILGKLVELLPIVLGPLSSLAPPWPSVPVVTALVGLIPLLAFFTAFARWRKQHVAGPSVGIFAMILLLFVVAAMGYLWLWSKYVVTFSDEHGGRYVVGYTMHPNVAQLAESDPSLYTNKELLDRFDRDPTQVWTQSSLTVNRLLLIGAWIALWLLPSWMLIYLLDNSVHHP